MQNVHRRPLLRPRFGEEEASGVEFEFGQHHSRADSCLLAWRAPAQPARNHEVEDEKELVLESDDDPLAESTDAAHKTVIQRVDRRVNGAQDKWAERESAPQHQAGDTRIQRVDVQHDVGQFGHAPLWREFCSPCMLGDVKLPGRAYRLTGYAGCSHDGCCDVAGCSGSAATDRACSR